MHKGFIDKTPEAEGVKRGFVERLEGLGYKTHKRESFLRWRDQDVYLVQKEGFSAVMFIKASPGVSPGDELMWRLNKDLFESFAELAADDEDTALFVVLLEASERGFVLKAEEFEAIRGGLKTDDSGEMAVAGGVVEKSFPEKRFSGSAELIERLTESA